jgi:hypothetical protein
MSESGIVKVGDLAVNLAALASAHMEGGKLFMHFVGGRFESATGEQAVKLWKLLAAQAVDLDTGEVGSRRA